MIDLTSHQVTGYPPSVAVAPQLWRTGRLRVTVAETKLLTVYCLLFIAKARLSR